MAELTSQELKDQYELLTIVDNKAMALLSFNTILLAAISIWLGYVGPNYLHFSLDIAFLTLLVSCVLLLWVIWLYWWRPKEDPQELEKLRMRRTGCYRTAWRVSMGAVIGIGLVSAVHTVGTGLTAINRCESGWCQWFFSDEIFGNLDSSKRRGRGQTGAPPSAAGWS